MQVTPRSSTSTARRQQIVAATVEVIAGAGFAQASFARIAQSAGLSSTRLISYHFTDKDELVAAVVEHVVTAMGEAVGARVAAQRTAADRLAAYVEGVVAFTDEHRTAVRALLLVVLAGALPPGAAGTDDAVPSHLEALLRQGQADGEFRGFDAQVMAVAVQRAVEGLPFLLQTHPDLDCAAFGRELVVLFDLATRARPA